MIDRVSCYPNPCGADEVCDASLPFDGEPGRAFCQRRHAAGEDCQQRDRDLNDCVDRGQPALPARPGLHLRHWPRVRALVDCGSNMACCATATGTGAECRPGALDQCTPPAGSCRRPE